MFPVGCENEARNAPIFVERCKHSLDLCHRRGTAPTDLRHLLEQPLAKRPVPGCKRMQKMGRTTSYTSGQHTGCTPPGVCTTLQRTRRRAMLSLPCRVSSSEQSAATPQLPNVDWSRYHLQVRKGHRARQGPMVAGPRNSSHHATPPAPAARQQLHPHLGCMRRGPARPLPGCRPPSPAPPAAGADHRRRRRSAKPPRLRRV